MQKFAYLLITSFLFLSCSKDEDPHEIDGADTIAPVITITTPTNNEVFTNGASLNVTGMLTDDKGLYRGTIKITNDANAAVIKEQTYEIHGLLSYNFNLSQVLTVTSISDYTITVKFEDHGRNESTKSVKIRINP